MSPTITSQQRDALYGQITERLSGIGDVLVAITAGNHEAAERLALEYSDELRLLLGGLGFGAGSGEPVELGTPKEVLLRALPRLRERAENHAASVQEEWELVGELRERDRVVAEVCSELLGGLGTEGGGA